MGSVSSRKNRATRRVSVRIFLRGNIPGWQNLPPREIRRRLNELKKAGRIAGVHSPSGNLGPNVGHPPRPLGIAYVTVWEDEGADAATGKPQNPAPEPATRSASEKKPPPTPEPAPAPVASEQQSDRREGGGEISKVQVIRDTKRGTLTIWLDDPAAEQVCTRAAEGIALMKDGDGRVIGFELDHSPLAGAEAALAVEVVVR